MEPTAPKAVFLSYASQDTDAARRIAEALRAEGIEVWFDVSELRGGESWDASIQKQIAECSVFVAIISANTQSRREGYFRLEWRLADERMRLMVDGTPFVLPVIIDGTKERDALVPKSFLGVQWTWLPHGEVPPAFVARVQRLLNPTAAVSTMSKPAFAPNTANAITISLAASKEAAEPAVTTARRAPRTAFVFATGALAMLAAVTLVVVVYDGGFGFLTVRGSRADTGVTKFTITLPPEQAVISSPAISRDGRMVAFTAGTRAEAPQLYVRPLDELEAKIIPGTKGASQPFWAPDGRSIAFFADGRLFRWKIGGGAPVSLANAPWPMGGTWGDDDTIIFVPVWNGGLFRVPGKGGAVDALLRPDGKENYAHIFPRIIPNRREILFSAWGKNGGVWHLDLSTGERTKLLSGDSGTVTTSGHLLAAVSDKSTENRGWRPGLLAAPYKTGVPSPYELALVVPSINYAPSQPNLWSSVSDNGTLVYVPADVRAKSLVLVDLTGQLELFSDQPGPYNRVRVSHTTRRIVAEATGLWLYAPNHASREKLMQERGGSAPVWMPDGASVVYASNHLGNWNIYRHALGASKSEPLLEKELDQFPRTISPDGTIAYEETHPTTGYDIWLLDPSGNTKPWLKTSRNEMLGRFSPDGKWLAYRSDESGRFEIYVKSVVGDAARIQVSFAGGGYPAWAPNGNTLFYQEAGAMWTMDLGSGEVPVPGQRRKLFEGGWALNPPGEWDYCDFDVMPDGKHFVMIRGEPKSIPDRINVVLNWYDELRRLVPVK